MMEIKKPTWNITGGDVARYTLTPQIGIRIGDFIASGFHNLAYFMVLVYRAVNLIPANHRFLNHDQHGTYSILDVMAEAAKNLQFDKKHIDQVVIFFSLLAGIILLALQFILFIAFMMTNPAIAQDMPSSYAGFVEATGNTEDIALRMLDMVFGVPDIFGNTGVETDTAFHKALRGMFQAYSIGLLVIAALIIVYFIIAIVAETAQTGTPFGKRYNHAWAPIRLVVAIGLLVPISHGLNSGQWITLYAAKFGSGFATNGWNKFNETLNDTYIPKEKTIATPSISNRQFHDLAAFFMLAHACKEGYVLEHPETGEAINAYLIKREDGGKAKEIWGMNYIEAVQFAGSSKTLRIRIGEKNDEHRQEIANVYPYCGELTLTVPEDPDAGETGMNSGGPWINLGYFVLINQMWGGWDDYEALKTDAENMMRARHTNIDVAGQPSANLKNNIIEAAKKYIQDTVEIAVQTLIEENSNKPDDYKKYGWGGAGLWYNTIAEKNGSLTSAAMNKPQVTTYPSPMEKVCAENRQQNKNTEQKDCYRMRLADGRRVQFNSDKEKAIAKGLSDVYDYWYKAPVDVTGNAFIDAINWVLGTEGLFSMCKNANIHPLAQMSSIGRGLVDAAIRNLGFGIGLGLGSFLPYVGPALDAASGFAMTVGGIGILIGFILYYLLPFMPFLYFLFAVGGWVKGLFEAMVGIPLWALAHIRIDGEGLPGDAASGGYFLIFEIFIRPILIVFGLLASLMIFSAMVKTMNEIFYLAVSNMAGAESGNVSTTCGKQPTPGGGNSPPVGSIDYFRGPVDQFFFTIVYAILVYMIGMSSFKLIDLIPNGILRWMGQGIKTFSDQAGEPADGLIQKMAVGGTLLSSVVNDVGGKAKEAVGHLGKSAFSKDRG